MGPIQLSFFPGGGGSPLANLGVFWSRQKNVFAFIKLFIILFIKQHAFYEHFYEQTERFMNAFYECAYERPQKNIQC